MIIVKRVNGIGKNKSITYDICNSVVDTDDNSPDVIISLKTLELAVIVMRYMNGHSLSDNDEYRAKEALKKAAAPTD